MKVLLKLGCIRENHVEVSQCFLNTLLKYAWQKSTKVTKLQV